MVDLADVERIVDDWDDAQLAGQLLVVGYDGQALPPRLAQALARGERGGVVLFRRNLRPGRDGLRELQETCRRVRELSPLPPVIAIDEEGGRVARLREPALVLPPMRRLAELGGAEWLERVARAVARELSVLGLNVNFAPVVDVDTNPENPIIGDRALARDPESVVAFARAYLRGLRQGGVAGCLKHFPGHGDTREDSHVSLPFVPHSRQRLVAVELEPFRALAADVDCVMTAHVAYPALDAQRPATLSRPIVYDILRRRFGFSGLIFSDDLEMQAIAARGPLAASAEEAVWAGCDSLLVCHREDEQQRIHRALARRLGRDPEFRQRAREAAFRSLGLRLRYPPAPRAWSDFERLEREELRPLQRDLDALTQSARGGVRDDASPVGERRWDDGSAP